MILGSSKGGGPPPLAPCPPSSAPYKPKSVPPPGRYLTKEEGSKRKKCEERLPITIPQQYLVTYKRIADL